MKMNKNSNAYIILYAAIMIVIVAVLLSFTSIALKDRQNANIEVEKQGAILASIGLGGDAAKAKKDKSQYVQDEYAKYIVDSYVIDYQGNRIEDAEAFALLDKLKAQYAAPDEERQLPVFTARLDNGKELNILPVYGSGLWGPIWGYIALEEDWNTVYGATFDHSGETPGLGAEITSPGFSNQFRGKKIFRDGRFVGISVLKGEKASLGNDHAVDAVSGGTITSRGIESMIILCLKDYLPLIEKQQAGIVGNIKNS